ncbi:tetratricopeptide repeat protein [Gallionella capsiferriformans]|uniref:protein O-GlcNAc transferase n=1 Tax=Gallionella capsiferriformans (strain ES-2) TaxID=395494 RepID=D9SF32_GALCS|nr:tetratricopeptide repeat protein [Gallionella capsiferriformans]ADL55129.1 Tetratricopeptide TPR_1 repeat-containing protein [Gallionella capsiferriformans ES-2]
MQLTSEQMLQRAVAHQQAGEYQDAERYYLAILQADPHHPEANHNAGVMAVQMKQPALGLPYLLTALEADPGRARYWISYIDALLQSGQMDEAQQVLSLAIQQGLQGHEVNELTQRLGSVVQDEVSASSAHPSRAQIDHLVELFGKRQYAESAELARKMTLRYPAHEFGWKALGAALKQLGRTEEALAAMQRSVELSPDDVEVNYNLGVVLQEAGRLDEAEQSYRRAVALNAAYADAHCNLGVVLQELGRASEAEACYRRAIQINPRYAAAYSNLANTLMASAELAEAEKCCRRALEINPGAADAHSTLGHIFEKQGDLAAAEASFRRALQINPDSAADLSHLGSVLKAQGRLDEADICYRRALQFKPDYADAHYNLATLLKEQGRPDEAENSYRQALRFNPDFVYAYYNVANVLLSQSRLTEAESGYREAIRLKPDFAEAHNNLGIVLRALGRPAEAEASYLEAIRIQPDYAEAHSNLGITLHELGRSSDAVRSINQALLISPMLAEAHCNLGNVLLGLGRQAEAQASYRRALQCDPDFAEAHSNLIFTMDLAVGSDTAMQQQERKNWHAAHAAHLYQQRNFSNARDPDKRLRIGYVSADFRVHSAAYAFGAMLTKFSPDDFEIVAYSNSNREDAMTQRFQQHVTLWRKIIGMSDQAVVDMILADGIDILVDLSGHSSGNRLLVFARKPAPIQITAWGYASGTGLRAMDVFFSDTVFVPPEETHLYAEQVRYLPCAISYFAPDIAPDVSCLPALSGHGVTFGSYNRLAKNSEAAYRAWAKILRAVPDSRMIFKTPVLDDAAVQDQVRAYFTSAGVAAERIILLGKSPHDEHMAAFNQIDISLDPFPHGGGVSALEGLLMGVPVVTLNWPSLAGRISASIMTTLAMPDWIAGSEEEYVQLAIQKATDIPSLSVLRGQLRGRFMTSVIGDQTAYVRYVEREYRQLWREWCVTHPVDLAEKKSNLNVDEAGGLPDALSIASVSADISHPSDQAVQLLLRHFSEASQDDAWLLAQEMTKNFPSYGLGWLVTGAILRQRGQSIDALAAMQKAAVLLPDDAAAINNLGLALHDVGRLLEAEATFRRALAMNPDFAEAYGNLGNTLHALGRLSDAEDSYQRAIRIKPDFPDAYNNLSITLKGLGRLVEAEGACRRALQINPGFAEAFSNLGFILKEQWRLDEAEASIQQALSINSTCVEAHCNLAATLLESGKSVEAEASLRRALQLRPDDATLHSNLIFTLDLMTGESTASLQKERRLWNDVHAAHLPSYKLHRNLPSPERRLRIGYVSADFRMHSAAYAFTAMLLDFDREQFEVIAYSNSKIEDKLTETFKKSVTLWRDIVGLPDDEVDDLIRQEGVDILVDLSGHTAGNRLLVFARKPAPIQITAFGYAAGTGMDAMDVLFADEIFVPRDEVPVYAERVRYLPCAVSMFISADVPDPCALPALSGGGITFGSFNRLVKISEQTYLAWAKILRALPDSRLILKTHALDDAGTRERVSEHFIRAGIDPARIILLGKTSREAQLAAFNRVDIALDTFPHGGGMTTLEGLVMGVPVVTLRWPTLTGRVSASILTTLGMPDWIAESQDEYVKLAIQKAADLQSLSVLRGQLRGRFMSSVIGNQAAYVRCVEREYRLLWREWCARRPNARIVQDLS